MSTRKQFIAALAAFVGIGRAQQWRDKKRAAVNGQCPVCGEITEPFHKPSEWDYYPSGFSTTKNGKREPINLARCARCNAAFWQDVE